jgi:hypothetical protein
MEQLDFYYEYVLYLCYVKKKTTNNQLNSFPLHLNKL